MSEVKFKEPSKRTCFKNLEHGELFMLNTNLYIKTDNANCAAVAIPSGIVCLMTNPNAKVERVKAKLILEE